MCRRTCVLPPPGRPAISVPTPTGIRPSHNQRTGLGLMPSSEINRVGGAFSAPRVIDDYAANFSSLRGSYTVMASTTRAARAALVEPDLPPYTSTRAAWSGTMSSPSGACRPRLGRAGDWGSRLLDACEPLDLGARDQPPPPAGRHGLLLTTGAHLVDGVGRQPEQVGGLRDADQQTRNWGGWRCYPGL
jgi:hypothetical protein